MKTLIAMPCMDTVQTAFMSSLLNLRVIGPAEFGITKATLLFNARNMLAERAIRHNCGRILFLDSDMVFQPDLMERLAADMDRGMEFVSALYFRRVEPVQPVIYRELEYKQTDEGVVPTATPYIEYPRGSIFEVQAAGFGACMISTDLIRRVAEKDGIPFAPVLGFGEDLSFCWRVRSIGAKMYCDSSIRCGHIMQTVADEEMWDARQG